MVHNHRCQLELYSRRSAHVCFDFFPFHGCSSPIYIMRAVTLLTIAVMIAAAAAKKPLPDEIAAYSFDQFVADFRRGYQPGTEEYEHRRGVFEAKKKEAVEHNACPRRGRNYKKAINQFSDMTEEEFRVRLGGRIRANWKVREQIRKSALVKTVGATGKAVPESVDWRGHVPSIFTGVKDQGQCGSCWAHAATENLESHWALRTGQLFTLSQQQAVACAPNPNDCGGTGGCMGSIADLAYQYWATAGVAEEWTYPYTAYWGTSGTCASKIYPTIVNVTGFTSVNSNDQQAVMEALAFTGPLAINVDASQWSSYGGGIYDGCSYAKNISIDHVVQLVGYGYDYGLHQSYWIVRNSWTPAWGENGYIRLIRHQTPECGWDVDPQDGTACKGSPDQLWVCGQCGILFDTLYPNVEA